MISIVLATYNEKETIVPLINDLFKHCPEGEEMEIIVVDDDSPDGTHKIVENLQDPRVKVIKRIKARGLASAFNRGIIESKGNYVGWMDADLCMPASLIPKMHRMIVNENYDAILGSRYAQGGMDDRSLIRRTSSRLINKFANLVLGYGIKDYDSGFILVKRSVFNSATLIPIGYGEYFIEFVYNMCRNGLKVGEIGYYFRDRAEQEGRSKSYPNIPSFLTTGLWYALRIIRARFRKRR